jgi:hypothetical protein
MRHEPPHDWSVDPRRTMAFRNPQAPGFLVSANTSGNEPNGPTRLRKRRGKFLQRISMSLPAESKHFPTSV